MIKEVDDFERGIDVWRIFLPWTWSVRFANKLTFTIDIPEDKWNLRIPVLSLLPLVENATVHNIIDSDHRMDIRIELNEREWN